jgi:CDP-diacylglycerol--glycerol-3-phosphate 3-phosphatidyltransferase
MPRSGAVRQIPNILTTLRLLAIPVFVVALWTATHGRSWVAGLIFAGASITDWFDGYLARRLAVQSRYGRLVDPLADRLLIASAVLILWHRDRVPLVAVILILGRDAVLLSGLGLAAAERGYELSVVYIGKAATFVLMTALGLTMVVPADALVPRVLLYVGIALSLVAGAVYVVTARGRLRRAQGSPAP